ncbi:hypothetical protein ABZ942_00440 [Nocardia sp. NPDC046473]|uniref:hypothetical protein n=1 Tax=Nocardia sp. NPDC046473 TaxID=3155733 RepID=UPI0033C55AE1
MRIGRVRNATLVAGSALLFNGILIGVAPLAHAVTTLSIGTEARGFDGGEGEEPQVITVSVKYACDPGSGISKIGITATQVPFHGSATGKGNLGNLNCDGAIHSELVKVRSSAEWDTGKDVRIKASLTDAANETVGSATSSEDATIFACGSTNC